MAGRVAVVTGGTRGIGACRLADAEGQGLQGCRHLRRQRRRRRSKFKAETGIAVYKFDVGDFAACQSVVARSRRIWDRSRCWSTTPASRATPTMRRLTRDMWDAVIDTNLGSCFNMSKAVWDGMNTRGFGRIVNIGSINGQGGQYGQVNYAAAKSGIHGFTKALAQEGASKGITVNAIAPGYTETDMVSAVPANVLEKIVAKIPVGRLGKADEIGARRDVPDRRRCRLHHRLDAVDQRRPAYVLTNRAETRRMGAGPAAGPFFSFHLGPTLWPG